MSNEMVTAREAAEYIGADYTQMAAWRSAKKGPPFTKRAEDGRVFYRPCDLDDWLEAKRQAEEQKALDEERERERQERSRAREREMNDGHEFAGWEPAVALTDEQRAAVAELWELRSSLSSGRSLDGAIARIEGDLVATCACGWRGVREEWESPELRGDRGGLHFLNHQHNARIAKIQREYAATVAAAALRHAAEDWTGDEAIIHWLVGRAEHIELVGDYDSETWPD
jgi:hypothetical protein